MSSHIKPNSGQTVHVRLHSDKGENLRRQLKVIATFEGSPVHDGAPPPSRWSDWGNRKYRCTAHHVGSVAIPRPQFGYACGRKLDGACNALAFITFPEDKDGPIQHEAFSEWQPPVHAEANEPVSPDNVERNGPQPIVFDVSEGKPAGAIGMTRKQCESMYAQLRAALGYDTELSDALERDAELEATEQVVAKAFHVALHVELTEQADKLSSYLDTALDKVQPQAERIAELESQNGALTRHVEHLRDTSDDRDRPLADVVMHVTLCECN